MSIHNISSEDLKNKALTENLSLDSTRILESLLNHAPAGIAIFEGPDLRYVNINQNLADLNGLPVENHLRKPLKEVLPDAEKNLLPVMHKIMKDGKAVLGREFSITLPKDPDRPIHLIDYLFPIPDKQGKPIGIGAIVLDITRRKETEGALRLSEKKYRSLVENLNVGIYILQNNKFVYVNETFEKILGYKLEEVSLDSFNFMDLIAPESKKFILERSISREKGEKIDVNYVFKCITKTGNIIDLEANTSAIEYEGKPAIQGLLKDVTTQMQDRRDKLILQEKLKQSERLESLGLLAGGVAHDLNNIIGPIMAYPALIKMNLSEGKPVEEDLDAIRESAQRAADVISDLLALTRRGSHKMEPIDLNDLVKDYLSSAECKVTKSLYPEVASDIQLSESTLLFKGSKAHLPKVIMNLINNAYESMSEGGVLSVTTSSISVEDGEVSDKHIRKGRYNLLTIEDQGEGIPEENISKIFDPFFTTKIKTGKSGTGLGLSVVYNVLKDHGAHIDVESNLGIGTKFSIYFPESTEKKETILKDSQIHKGSGSILVVDDREDQRDLATRILTKLGYDVESVDSGQDAIDFLEKADVDLLLLDMILEEDMDGLDTYKEIIKIKPDQKTIIVSGYSESGRVKVAEELGVNGFIQKPYKMNEIGLTIQDVLGGNNNS
ncbi:MAG: PAS domain S-box protein [Candidatus Marinimicrobia bacterium]|nr:PAS domain S-box protein [Candidatus Neomarinimicrobiota bacterium]